MVENIDGNMAKLCVYLTKTKFRSCAPNVSKYGSSLNEVLILNYIQLAFKNDPRAFFEAK